MIKTKSTNIKQKILLTISLIPFTIITFQVIVKLSDIHISRVLLIYCLLLFLSGLGLTSSRKEWNKIGQFSTAVLVVDQSIPKDFNHLLIPSPLSAIVLLLFFTIIYLINYSINKSDNSDHVTTV